MTTDKIKKLMPVLAAGKSVVAAGFLLMVLTTGTASAHRIPKPCDFVTGGGFIFLDSGAKANFGLVAGCKHHAFTGHLNYIDHDTGLHVKSITIESYTEPTAGSLRRDFCGTADTNQFGEVKFHAAVVDNGEPGTADRFGLALSNGYIASTRTLGGGNIQLHKPNPSTTPPPTFTECDRIAPNPGP
ncbi:MAG: hypothetical protein DMG73_14175 [Acidobacteria bacterium]|nr:MAG: hypothetical protein DMG73_14175 [Acidobacteriota bacterium]PYX63443.1 MAG: hypothetical protein DMG74_17015 [Acidobacteriota bacterium]